MKTMSQVTSMLEEAYLIIKQQDGDLRRLRAAGDAMAKIIDTIADADVNEGPTNDGLSAAVNAWRKAKT